MPRRRARLPDRRLAALCCLVADFEDGIRQQLSTFRCGLGGCMEEIKQRVTQRPDFGQYQFGGISGPLSRSAWARDHVFERSAVQDRRAILETALEKPELQRTRCFWIPS